MSHLPEDKKMLDAVSATLDKSCDSLDGYTLSRLNKIRHDALAQSRRRKAMLGPFGGFVTASVLVFIVSLWYQNSAEILSPNSAIEDLEILTSSESLEFFEDFEFYQWLEENESSV